MNVLAELLNKNCEFCIIFEITYKIELVNRVSFFQNYPKFSDVIAERTKKASENGAPVRKQLELSDCVSGNGIMMIMPNEESE